VVCGAFRAQWCVVLVGRQAQLLYLCRFLSPVTQRLIETETRGIETETEIETDTGTEKETETETETETERVTETETDIYVHR